MAIAERTESITEEKGVIRKNQKNLGKTVRVMVDRQTGRHKDRHAQKQTQRQTDRHKDRQIHRHADRQTDGYKDRQIHRDTKTDRYIVK